MKLQTFAVAIITVAFVFMISACSGEVNPKSEATTSPTPEYDYIASGLSNTLEFRGLYLKTGTNWSKSNEKTNDDGSSSLVLRYGDNGPVMLITVFQNMDDGLRSAPDGSVELETGDRDDWTYAEYSVDDESSTTIGLIGFGTKGAGFRWEARLVDTYNNNRNISTIQKMFDIAKFNPDKVVASGSVEEVEEDVLGFASDQHVDELSIVDFSIDDDGSDYYDAVFTVKNNTEGTITFAGIDAYALDKDGNVIEYSPCYMQSSDEAEIAPGQSAELEMSLEHGDGVAEVQSKKYEFNNEQDIKVQGVFSKTFSATVSQ